MEATPEAKITCLWVDIGGVLLSDGWGHKSRALAAKKFALNLAELEIRHRALFESYELGNVSLHDYLNQVVFYQARPFTVAEFQHFMFSQSKPDLPMIEMVKALKKKYNLKIIVVSNEARELNEYRIRKFKLNAFVDSFISSCFVHLRKPDEAIFKLALDLLQIPVRHIVYLENSPLFVQVAESLGIQSILHTDYKTTCTQLASLGLQHDAVVLQATSS